MSNQRIKISSIIENQLPQYVREEFPLVSEFLKQYYISQENSGGTLDILQNIDSYVKVDNLTNLTEFSILENDVTFFDTTISVDSTLGFPDSYGLLLIDDEIITYTSKTNKTFDGCVRGFSGVTSYQNLKDELTFSDTEISEHTAYTKVINLSILFLKEFLLKIKKQFTPGFENRDLYSELNQNLFIKQSIDFYTSKGTDNSFKILFGALYGEKVEIIKPRDYVIQASDAQYRITADLVVESINGNPEELVNKTLYQDATDYNKSSQGTITKVEKIFRESKEYYVISLDYDYDKDILPSGTVYGKFTIHPKTKLVRSVVIGSDTLEVDSTVGFPVKNGNLIINLENGNTLNVSYESKTLNQFLNCSGITDNVEQSTEIKLDAFAYGYGINDIVKIRILGVLSDLKIPDNTYLYSKGDSIKIKSLGIDLNDYKSNNWFFNISVKYQVISISNKDTSDNSYVITTKDKHYFNIGDSVTFISSSDIKSVGKVSSYDDEKTFHVVLGVGTEPLNSNSSYYILKNVSNPSFINYPEVNKYTANVQNVYSDEDSLYVASSSLPYYRGLQLETADRSKTFNGTFNNEELITIQNHGFYTGDSVVVRISEEDDLNIDTGIYFIKKVNINQIKLSRSRNNIFTENYIQLNGTSVNTKIEFVDFTYKNLIPKTLNSSKLIRKISDPQDESSFNETEPGLIGVLVNGVEILNYKSKDKLFYGPIENIVPTSSGSDYDVINPPILTISDPIGFGASGYCSVNGQLERIDIIDPGFDYIETPKIEITGGNGSGAFAEANLVLFDHSVDFNSQSTLGTVKLDPINTIEFSEYHKFRDTEEVIYETNDQTSVGGLIANSSYFVSVIDAYKVQLFKSAEDANSGINTIKLTSYGVGTHTFKCRNKKKKIGSITVKNIGYNYQNKPTSVSSVGINTSSDIIHIKNHGYESGEIVVYRPTDLAIGGLTSSFSYYVTKVNDNEFKLSSVGGITTSFYYDTKQYINFTTTGTGIHKFNYPEIKVEVKGRIGISTFSNQNWNAVVQPIFRGKIQSVFVESNGSNYGSEEILNYSRQPQFNLNSGSGGQLTPVISNGKIVKVIVNSSGFSYNSPPTLIVNGDGIGAVLTPVISNGSIIEVKVINGGLGYTSNNTDIEIISSGKGAKFESKIKSWTVNLVERLFNNLQILDDDGILTSSINSNYGLEYSHAYAPRYLRGLVSGSYKENGKTKYTQDLQFNQKELNSIAHSPIIGWAYDGNPIYGPYGYSTKTGGEVKCLQSGYKLKSTNPNRPNTSLYPLGFLIEDYEYDRSGDLDEHNGRFCVTPEYPNGTYAYFTTISPNSVETEGPFKNYKKPVFPYIIGNTYKSKIIDFNFSINSNQDFIDINSTTWKRNITPYNISNDLNSYEYINNSNKTKNHKSIVTNVLSGTVDSIGILTGGNGYKVGDKINFNNKFGNAAKAKVSLISGKPVSQISVATSSFDQVELYSYNQSFVGFTTIPHNYLNTDLITFTGKYDFNKTSNIQVQSNILTLSSGIGSANYTGIITYFNVSGNLKYPNIRENDIYKINDEEIKILNIDEESSRIRVLRNYNNTVGLVSYSSGTILSERSRKFNIDFGISTSYSFNINREFYFNPKESVGLGTISGVGIVSTLYFSNPGVGVTQLNIPTRTIFIQNHNLNTGDSLVYSSNGGSPIGVSTNGVNTFSLLENSEIYVAKINNNLIGISTIKVGLGSLGNVVSVGSTLNSELLYFTSLGSGNNHSFKTNYDNILSGSVSKNEVTVSTASSHGLSLYDNVKINVLSGIDTSFSVKYNDYNRRLVINPRSFTSIDINTGIIFISNHGYYTGQKVIYSSNIPSPELTNNGIYFIISVNSNQIKLSNSYYDAINLNSIDVSVSSSGTISPINPPIKVLKNQNVIFDLSDSSLSFSSNLTPNSAFELKFYKDEKLSIEYESVGVSSNIIITQIGKIGIDTTSKVTLRVNDEFSGNLYYNLVPVNLDQNTDVKKQILVDSEVLGSNKVTIDESLLNGTYQIIGITTNTFKYTIPYVPEVSSYTNNVVYYTDSLSSEGGIENIKITSGGKYHSLPAIESISSSNGNNAILQVQSNSTGKIISTEIEDIGFNYSPDFSIRPTVKLPDILDLETLYSFDYIEITSFGKGYSITPNLIVIDGLTNEVVDDVILNYSFGDSQVTISKNSNKLNKIPPKIIPINNSNGIKIKNISYNNTTKDVTVTLDSGFSSLVDFPFFVGEKVLIEGTSVGISSTGTGYNSSNYGYALFTVTNIDPKIGGIGATVTYNLNSYLKSSEVPGIFNSLNSFGKIIPQSYFPTFNPILKRGKFYKGENVYVNSTDGVVEYWDENNGLLKVSTIKTFNVGDIITGETSGSSAIIKKITEFIGDYIVDSFSERRKSWNKETGFLNNDSQRIHDNDYYQYFSYDVKSKKDFSLWKDAVSTLNHTAGFKKFANLIVESEPTTIGISTSQNEGDFSGTLYYSSVIDLNCVNDYDLVRENNLVIDNTIYSNEILFNSAIIQDYIESVGNRVLIIDDISSQFNSNPRSTEFSTVDSFLLSDFRSKKYIVSISDINDSTKKQLSSIALLYDNTTTFLNQYGINSYENLGSFDFTVFGSEGNLIFYPVYSKFNNYHVKLFSFSLSDSISGIGTVNLGNVSKIKTTTATIPQGTSSPITIVGVATTSRSFKTLVQIGATDGSYYEYQEITCLQSNGDIHTLEYGQLTTNSNLAGIGTYNAYISGSNIILDLTPNESTTVDYVVNAITISLSNSSFSGIGTQTLSASQIQSKSVSIAASTSPISNEICSISNSAYDGSYFIVQVEDKTNLEYQVSEVLIISDLNSSYISEYGIINTKNNLGILTSGISGSNTILYFTPINNIDVDVKLLSINIGLSIDSDSISLNNGSLDYNYGSYTGTNNDVKNSFALTHKNLPIFERTFNASSSSVVNTITNTITIPYHFYVTGEEIFYEHPTSNGNQPIGIGTTFITGIGNTDKLPSSLYVVKISDSTIGLAASATDALKTKPKLLSLTSVGIGSVHKFISKNQNKKALITIDNVIQSPIVSTSTTSTLIKNIDIFDSQIYTASTNNLYGGDLIQVDNEIMRINSVGIGSTNSINVTRTLLGTGISTHSTNSLVTKIYGNYNIVNNIIYFSSAPYGKVPFVNPSNRPDEIDYSGISTSSSFSGRIFLRSGITDTTNEAYHNNYIFDDISLQFDGSKKSFTLTSSGNNITGVSTDNAILLVNEIFQSPSSLTNIDNYSLSENSGITSVSFVGVARSTTYDVNTSSIPRGGIIVSVGSTQGFGYQPLISAGGTAVVSTAGTIQSISIGNSGSGYRSGIQTNIRVGIKTENLDNSHIEFVGIASSKNGNIVSVAITNPGIGYTNYSEFKSTSTSSIVSIGSTVIPLSSIEGISPGNYITVGTALTNVYIVGVGSTSVNIGIANTISSAISSGTTAIIKYYNPPIVVFDSPLSYSNIPLVYSSSSSSGIGTGATVDIVVGQGSSVISFEIKNFGYAYKANEVLTVSIGGTTGIQTTSDPNFSEFQISIDRVYQDKFSGWTVGNLQVIDSIEVLFDGKRKVFPILINGNQTTIRSKKGSIIDETSVQASLLVFVNDILQVPGEGYIFRGGSTIQFTEAPKPKDKCRIIFYKGTGDLDTINVDILETIKEGDKVVLTSDKLELNENERLVENIVSSDVLNTTLYPGPGITNDENLLRPLTWCRQTEDTIINGQQVSKNRIIYEPYIQPQTNIIQNVGIDFTYIFVESVKAFFDSEREYLHNGTNEKPQNKILIISQDSIISAAATAIVSIAGTISSIVLSDAGIGYTKIPSVSIGSPIGIGSTGSAIASATISNGSVSNISITNGGIGYTPSTPPVVLIQSPSPKTEVIDNVSYEGDYGVITGVSTVSVGVASTGIVFDFFIPLNSPLRDSKIVSVGLATTGISGIQTGYYFMVRNSTIGKGVTSLDSSGNVVGIGTSFLDNVYRVASVSIAQTSVPGIGITNVSRITVSLSSYNGLTGLGYSSFYGEYSWGRISTPTRVNPYNFQSYAGVGGISTSPIIQRYNRLKYVGYSTT